MIAMTHRRTTSLSRRALLGNAAALAVSMSAGQGWAQDYPTRPVRIIVPYPAGGATDIVARVMQEWLTRKWNQPVVIDNRSGAAGNIGTETAFKSEPDGYTILVNAPSPMTVNKNLYAKLNFEPSEFVPVALAVLSAEDIPTCVAIAHEKVQVSPGSSVASLACAPVRCSSQFASSNT